MCLFPRRIDPLACAALALIAACDGASDAERDGAASSGGDSGATISDDAGLADASDDAGTIPPAACLPQAFLESMPQRFSCEAKPKIEANVADLPFDCHSQGIGWHPATQGFVTSCMDVGGPSARVLAFPALANDSGQWLAENGTEVNVDADTRHPSAFQIGVSGVFPIAMAPSSDSGPSEIRFFRLDKGQITGPLGSFQHEASHIGAMAYATLSKESAAGSESVLVGCGWDCATLSVWASAGTDATEGFSLVHHGPTSALVLPGVDENVGTYNSLYLVERCEDRSPLLIASHDDWIDVWLVTDLFGPKIGIQKIASRQIREDVVLHQDRPIFYEGMTLELTDGEGFVWAAPHDFGTDLCPAGTRCAQYVYRCRFGG